MSAPHFPALDQSSLIYSLIQAESDRAGVWAEVITHSAALLSNGFVLSEADIEYVRTAARIYTLSTTSTLQFNRSLSALISERYPLFREASQAIERHVSHLIYIRTNDLIAQVELIQQLTGQVI